ncbi:hypothetical protein OAJ04_04895 [Candidatus Nitrosopelagicus sp.]|nr:hypothetical protein [Candidatus Nitrosopelagicus sp.]
MTTKDFQAILLWYELHFKKKNKPTLADINTYTKIKAMAISEKEDDEKYNRVRI